MKPKPSEILRRARALVEKPECWVKHSPNRDEREKGLFCSDIAIKYTRFLYQNVLAADVLAAEELFARMVLAEKSYDSITRGSITQGELIGLWNDAPERTHAEVLAAFDRAIALAESVSV